MSILSFTSVRLFGLLSDASFMGVFMKINVQNKPNFNWIVAWSDALWQAGSHSFNSAISQETSAKNDAVLLLKVITKTINNNQPCREFPTWGESVHVTNWI